MKKSLIFMGFLFSTVSHAAILGEFDDMDDGEVLYFGLLYGPITTTTLPTMLVADIGETISIEDKLPELEAEIKAGPEQYYYLRGLAAQASLDKKYNGDTAKALVDVIKAVNLLIEAQKDQSR